MDQITLSLPSPMRADLERLSEHRDQTPGAILRDLLAKELKRVAQAKTPNRADEPLVARLQRLLAADMASASDWAELVRVLNRKGIDLRPAGGGLCLHDLRTGDRLCKSSELGFPYARLVRKFRSPMPGHPHRMRHVLHETAAGADPDGDIVLIEDD